VSLDENEKLAMNPAMARNGYRHNGYIHY